jgi:hypothetical protein
VAQLSGTDAERILRSAEPARLRVHDWSFTATGAGAALEVAHHVRGVALSRTTLAPDEAAAKLAVAVLAAAAEQGLDAQERTAAVIGALGEVLGL